MTRCSLLIAAASCFLVFAPAAYGRTAFDGSWDLVFVTLRGACDSSFTFTVDVTNGIVTHPNLVRFRGNVTRSGAVRASVTVQEKYATGAGKLLATSGRGDLERPLRNGAMLRLLDSATQLRDATIGDFGSNSDGAKRSYGEERIVGAWRS
jgi:hypothetical protein